MHLNINLTIVVMNDNGISIFSNKTFQFSVFKHLSF